MPNSHRHLHRRSDGSREDAEDWTGNDGDESPYEPLLNARDAVTVVKTVYQTQEPTFEGGIGGYTSYPVNDDPQPTAAADSAATQTADAKANNTPNADNSNNNNNANNVNSAMPTVIQDATLSSALTSTLAHATGQATLSATDQIGGETQYTTPPALPTTTSDSDSSTSKDDSSTEGTSAGAKAGIAFGVLGGLFAVGILVWFLFNRRKKQGRRGVQEEDDDDEKIPGADPMVGASSPAEPMFSRSEARAPRISLRPVTQFFPNWNIDKRSSKGAAMTLSPAAAAGSRGAPSPNGWDRPPTSQSTHSANPFGNQAERVPSPVAEEHSLRTQSPVPSVKNDPFANDQGTNDFGNTAIAGAAGAAAVAGSGLSRKTSMRKDGPKNVDLTVPQQLETVPPSPVGTEFSDSPMSPGFAPAHSSGAEAIAAAGGPPNSAVHRVQLDFKPTLEDEMELRAGDLVRLLHEYDDGWALCIRLDRSQQGVTPRTCLSTRPVKPRPPPGQGPPRGPPVKPNGAPRGPGPNHPPGQRPMSPYGPPQPHMGAHGQRPASPAGRPMSPAGRPMDPHGRPMSPGPRPHSPGPRQMGPPGGRPQSPSGMHRRMDPAGPSPMNHARSASQASSAHGAPRKPVPGQAL